MDACGLAVTWEAQVIHNDILTVRGHLRHRSGHAVPLEYAGPLPDALKAQNAAQRMGSAITYAKRYAICSALNIQTGEDDDGNASCPAPAITAEQVAELKRLVRESGTDMHRLLAFGGVDDLADFPQDRFDGAVEVMRKRKDAASKGAQ
jgi:hypothetical protein